MRRRSGEHRARRSGYRHLTAFDFAAELVDQARSLAAERGADTGPDPIRFLHVDATTLTSLTYWVTRPPLVGRGETAPGAIWAVLLFNGLMQIPGRDQRRAALRELHAVCTPWRSAALHDARSQRLAYRTRPLREVSACKRRSPAARRVWLFVTSTNTASAAPSRTRPIAPNSRPRRYRLGPTNSMPCANPSRKSPAPFSISYERRFSGSPERSSGLVPLAPGPHASAIPRATAPLRSGRFR